MQSLKVDNFELNCSERADLINLYKGNVYGLFSRNQERTNRLHYITIKSQQRHSICRASKMFKESVEALMLDRAALIESPVYDE